MRTRFRIVGGLLIVVGALCCFNAGVVLPSSMSWSGDWYRTDYAIHLQAFQSLSVVTVAAGALMVILSFTTLLHERDR